MGNEGINSEQRILYKYRSYTDLSLDILKKREVYFSDPSFFNDPFDCQINIKDALKAAIDFLNKNNSSEIKNRINNLLNFKDLYGKIENDVRSTGIFSLSKDCNNPLMWSHYADGHKGFCLGFELSENFTLYNSSDAIIGIDDTLYSQNNPYIDYFIEIEQSNQIPEFNEFWENLIILGLKSKNEVWNYEKEKRIIRGKPGTVNFNPNELHEIIFGLNMAEENRDTLRRILSGNEWNHVKQKEVKRESAGYKLTIVDI